MSVILEEYVIFFTYLGQRTAEIRIGMEQHNNEYYQLRSMGIADSKEIN